METCTISINLMRALYRSAPINIKQVIEGTLGKELFSVEITDRVKSVEDAYVEICEETIDESKLRDLGFTEDEIAYMKIKAVTRALNEGWYPDWTDEKQRKWIPYFYINSSSEFKFNVADFCRSATSLFFASCLCFKSEDLARYAGRTFPELYKKFIL